MKRTILSLLVICCLLSSGLVPAARSAGGTSAAISPAAAQLAATLDRMDVDHHWLPGMTIEWRSGKTLHPATEKGVHTHCSAFVAAACEALGAPMLSPPPQAHLANRQQDWLLGEGRQLGWTEVHAAQAQQYANQGKVAVVSFKNTSSQYHSGHGHIAMIRPAAKSPATLAAEGPQICQAGGHNFHSGPLTQGFGPPARAVARYFVYIAPASAASR